MVHDASISLVGKSQFSHNTQVNQHVCFAWFLILFLNACVTIQVLMPMCLPTCLVHVTGMGCPPAAGGPGGQILHEPKPSPRSRVAQDLQQQFDRRPFNCEPVHSLLENERRVVCLFQLVVRHYVGIDVQSQRYG